MAQITWMNTPIPDIGGTRQQGIRTAADLFNNATQSATAGVQGLQAIQAAEVAARTQAADRFALEKMLSTQDPVKYNQMRADGSLLGPAADFVSPATLQAAEARSGTLYTQARERNRNAELQAAEKVWDEAVKYATNDPAKAQAILSTANFTDANDSADFAKKARDLFVKPNTEGAARARKEQLGRASFDLAEKVMAVGANNPEAAARILSGEKDPLIRGGAVDRLTDLKQDTTQYYGPTLASNPRNAIVNESGQLRGRISDGPEEAQYKMFGNNLNMGMAAAGPNNPLPGTPEWSQRNGGRAPSQADIVNWGNSFVLPGSEAERGEGKGTTAIGPFQIVNKTRADFINRYGQQLFGTNDPARIPFTLENEEKLAAKIYQEQKAGAWQATQNYAGLKDGSAFKGVPWSEAKPIIQYIDGGVAPKSFREEIRQLEAGIAERELGLSEGQKVILNARDKANYGLAEATAEIQKSLGKESRPGEIRELVESTVRKAKEAGTTITHAEAAGLIMNAISDDSDLFSFRTLSGNLPTVADLRGDLDLQESKLVQEAKDLGNARADLKSFERNRDALKRVKDLAEKYKTDAAKADRDLAKARQSADAGESAISSFAQWQDTSDRIRKLVAPTTPGGVSSQLLQDARPAAQAPTQTSAPDIDLMLPPTARRPQQSPVQTLQNFDFGRIR